ncbi:ABC transporter permease [Microbacterium sp. NC79]|uniref:ABC transporter permease n=1 Tax=Microbacterium sp. NC79 TaxID=2851009 RepID=UPI001C2C3CDA|nr:ABC transporter permease [Microbacterium sp. NC79]MBV0894127.1 ABC transporter permease [Microbacterium sp. NC79]
MAWRRVTNTLVDLIIVLFVVSLGTFLLVNLMGSDPAIAILGEGYPEEEYEKIRIELGYYDPAIVRYFSWLGSVFTGDLGTQMMPPYAPVTERIASALPISVQLAVMGLGIALLLAIPLAMISAYFAGGRLDRMISAGAFGMLSIPSFLLGLIVIMVFANWLGWFPRAEWVRITDDLGLNLYHALLPALVIALGETATFTRILRNDLIMTLQEDFILAAKAKGMSPLRIMLSDALRPASLSMVTIVGISLGRLIGSTVIVEYLFALPGMGSLVISAASNGDVVTIQGAVMVIAVIYVLTNLLIDFSYGRLDPRIRRAHV